ncbi:hypothetical protein H7347_06910 [Corynebacterium sp. zg-331]|uniref:hypothetical protein n=1 Tax=unclassified Corynebacterium TaxID=2624378 RepID=UPI00128E6042|nr:MULTISPECIES: hypothetical protein [unclassified Corynebacterium]MBC3186302.1 hypothetical protein [Corynebacterium sp. zg-331]MPV52791.1 hypothetical protein [Corynebacterium sp. zg331]
MIDDADRYVLESALVDIERLVPFLDGMLLPTPRAAGDRVGGRTSPGSRVPLVADVLEVKRGLEPPVFGWSAVLADDRGVSPPGVRGLVPRARWMRIHLGQMATASWAPDALGEIVPPVAALRRLVDPAPLVRREGESPQVLVARASVSMPCAAAAQLLSRQGFACSRATLWRWARDEIVTSEVHHGVIHVWVDEVRSLLRQKRVFAGQGAKCAK